MYYVFFETGNEAFFSGIADAFCSIVMQSIINAYVKITSLRSSTPAADLDGIRNELEGDRKIWMPLNCTLFKAVYCGNRECADNRIVLTTDQLDRFEVSMTNTNQAFLSDKNYPENILARINIQKILQNCRFLNMRGVEHIPVRERQDHNEFLRSYITMTNRFKNKANGFVYVRAGINSDYGYFKVNSGLPDVKACDYYQQA